jgi:hypothetical protein
MPSQLSVPHAHLPVVIIIIIIPPVVTTSPSTPAIITISITTSCL